MSDEEAEAPPPRCILCVRPLVKGCDERGWLHIERPGEPISAARCPNFARSLGEKRVGDAGIPLRYRDARLSTYRIPRGRGHAQALAVRDACVAFATEPGTEGLLLWSDTKGTGKSHLACATLMGVLRRNPSLTGRFAETGRLLADIRASFDREMGGAGESGKAILEPLMTCSVLVLDELGGERPSGFVLDTLYQLVNHRYNHRLPTIYTTNHDPAAGLEARVGDRIASRLWGSCLVLPLNEVPDFRRQAP